MASHVNGNEDYVSREMLDIFFEFVDVFDNDLNLAVEEDCRSPNSSDAFFANEFASMSLPTIGAVGEFTYPRWSRPQFSDPSQRRKRLPRSEQPYIPDEFKLNDFQSFTLDSPPGQDYRYGDLYGMLNPAGQYASNQNMPGAHGRNNFQHQHSYLNDLQTYHGASPYAAYRQNYGSDNMRVGAEVMLSEAPRSYFKSCSKDRVGRMRSKHGDTHEELKQLTGEKKVKPDCKKMCVSEDFKLLQGKRKSDKPGDHDIQVKKQRFYFEQEEHYVVHKLLRELSSDNVPLDLPKTTSACLFYRLLSSKAEPKVMQTVGAPATSSRVKKIVVRDDFSEDQIGKYSHVGSSPFLYKHGAASHVSPTKSLKLMELLTTKSPKPSESCREDKENKNDVVEENAIDTSEQQMDNDVAVDAIR